MDNLKESKIIDYLYGTLSDSDREAVETEIQNDEGLKTEVDSMSDLRSFMSDVEDKEVIAPSFVFGTELGKTIPFYKSDFLKKVTAVAAGISLLLISAYFTNFQMSYSDNGFLIGFHSQEDVLNRKQEMKAMMQQVLAESQAHTDEKIGEVESKLTGRIDASNQTNMDTMQKLMASNTNYSRNVLKSYVKQINNENLEMIQNFFVVSNTQQQKYLKNVMTDFNNYYQNQRENDLRMIEAGLNNIQDNNDIKQYETDVVLANLMDIVKVKNK